MNASRERRAILLALLLAPVFLLADDSADLERATDQLALSPGNEEALRAAGLAALNLQRDHLAIYYFDLLLARQPQDAEARRGRAQAAHNAGLPEEGAQPRLSALVPPQGAYGSASLYVSALSYGGDTRRNGGDAKELDLRLGQWARGYAEVALVQTRLQLQPPLSDYDQREIKIGAGWLPVPSLLLRVRYGEIALDGADNNARWMAAGVDLLHAPPHLAGVEVLAGDYPAADTLAVTPKATVRRGPVAVSAAVTVQQTNPDEGQSSTRSYAKGRLEFEPSPVSTLALGGGAGHQAYAVEGFGDVVMNLPEERRNDAHFDVQRRFGHLVATWRSAVYGFDPSDDDRYHAVVHTLSLSYDGNGSLRPPPRIAEAGPERAGWFFSAGVQEQRMSLRTTARPVSPLVTSVSGPIAYGRQRPYQGEAGNTYYYDGIVYYDPFTTDPVTGSGEAFFSVANGGQVSAGTPYGTAHMSSREYSYRVVDDFHETESSDDDTAAGPTFTLRRVLAASEGLGSFQLAGRYGYSQVAQDSGRQEAARQTVWQDVRTQRFTYPVSLGSYIIWDTEAFSHAYPAAPAPPAPTESASTVSTIYEDYTAYTQTELEAGLHRLSLSLEWAGRAARWCELAAAAGPVLTLTDWRLRRSTEWDSNQRGLILAPADEVADGLETAWGFSAELAARFFLSGDDLYLELAGHYQDLRPLRLDSEFARAELELDDWSGSAGVGFSL